MSGITRRHEYFIEQLLESPEAREAYHNDALFHRIVDVLFHDEDGQPLALLGRLLATTFVADRRQWIAREVERAMRTP